MISVVDIFAGPGGLGEGFSSLRGSTNSIPFRVCVSIEKDLQATETLRLRSFFREFPDGQAPDEYYAHLRGEISRSELYEFFPKESARADTVAVNAELGSKEWSRARVRSLIQNALGKRKNFVLVGGPPCQAYSIVGRSRNKGISGYEAETDKRSTLYKEYLRILADHQPGVFVMENVKGLVSAKLFKQRLFEKLLKDLMSPEKALKRGRGAARGGTKRLGYRLYSLVEPGVYQPGEDKNFVVDAERFGIPQARHRVIILGVREDLARAEPKQLSPVDEIPLMKVIGDLPKLRSGLSKVEDSGDNWVSVLRSIRGEKWFRNGHLGDIAGDKLRPFMRDVLSNLKAQERGRGAEFVKTRTRNVRWNNEWFSDPHIRGVCNHATKSHMEKDLHRYIYAASYAKVNGVSPNLRDFPLELLPDHKNVKLALANGNFSDRFRVQLAHKPATTITSHIGKDGHYYIHPDPAQARSLTVREAARIQTFPDSYFFCGPPTQQYKQVGNAVPPLLARQIADIVFDVLKQARIVR